MTPTAAPGAAAPGGKPEKELYPLTSWKYDTLLWIMSVLAELFFREVHPRGSWKVPRHGPVLFVAAPHANQFVDSLILQWTLRVEAKRRVSMLIAQKSVHGFIGWASRQVGAVPVGRAQDAAKPAKGMIYLPDPVGDPTLIRGVGTDLEKQAEVGGMVFLPSVKGQSGSSVDIAEIVGPEELRSKRPFKGKTPMSQLTGRTDIGEDGSFANTDVRGCGDGFEGTKFKLAPHIDQTKVYNSVFGRLKSGGCVGIFPEGGSHDRTGLLPLKAGVAIMALGTLAEDPDCGLKIVPVGMNYFHAHKFRSRAVIEFGPPFEIPTELVHMYKHGQRRDAIAQVLDMVYPALSSVTVSAPDYDTLMLIQAARRLYNPTGKKLPLPIVVELNRRLAQGYEKYKDHPLLQSLMVEVKDYNKQLRYLNLRDHQVQYAKMPWWKVVFLFIYRIGKLLVLAVGVLPGLILFAPVFVASKLYSIKKAREALAGSSVKIQGRDVMATWKLLVAMAFAPILYNFYCVLFVIKVGSDRMWGWVPDWASEAPWWLVFLTGWVVFPAITFAALRFGEVGMDIVKSLRPLIMCINPSSSYNIQRLREQRAELQAKVTEAINTLGPEMFPDFEHTRLVKPDAGTSPPSAPRRGADGDRWGADFEAGTPPALVRSNTQSSREIPRNESFGDIGKQYPFSSGARSRSSSNGALPTLSGLSLSPLTSLDAKGGVEAAKKSIQEAMAKRQMRRRQSQNNGKGFQLAEDDESGGEDGDEYDQAQKKDM